MIVTIPRSKGETDPYYRYKRPVASVRNKGQGNGKMTVFTNLTAVATALHRPEAAILQALAKTLGTSVFQSTCQGHFDTDQIEDALEKVIRSAVICHRCETPDTYVDDRAQIVCEACGEKRVLEPKLATLFQPVRKDPRKKHVRIALSPQDQAFLDEEWSA